MVISLCLNVMTETIKMVMDAPEIVKSKLVMLAQEDHLTIKTVATFINQIASQLNKLDK